MNENTYDPIQNLRDMERVALQERAIKEWNKKRERRKKARKNKKKRMVR